MNIEDFENKIVITTKALKKRIIDLMSNSSKLLNIKIIDLDEFVEKFTFSVDDRAILFVMNKYNVIYEVAKIYLQNIKYAIEGYDIDKIDFLLDLRKELENNNLIIYNKLFRKYLNGKEIILLDLDYVDNYTNKLFDELEEISNVSKISIKKSDYKQIVYELNNKDDELAFVASKIVKLINDGVDINKIKIANLTNDYIFSLKKTFKLFNIPINLEHCEKCSGTILIKKFKEYFSNDIEGTIEKLKEYVVDNRDEELFNKIINVANSFAWSDNYEEIKDFIFEKINSISLDNIKYDNAVNEFDIENDYALDDEFVFLINFNEGSFPIYCKDEDYLNDIEKRLMRIDDSISLNNKKNIRILKNLKSIKNLVISYSKYNLSNELYISSLFNSEDFSIEYGCISYESSNKYNKLKLTCEKDKYRKFGSISEDLVLLNNNYKSEDYCSYDNSYKTVDSKKLFDYLNNKLSLSYSTMDTYYKCSFRYYLDHVLRLNKYEDNFSAVIGNIFHKILSECFVDNYEFEKRYQEEIDNSVYPFNEAELYFLKQLKGELAYIINTIKEQLKYISLNRFLYEQEIVVDINKNLNITFKGYIDKVLYDNVEGMNIAVIIDYKTGNPSLNLNNSYYGLNLQLPVYIYLLKNSKLINDVKIGGFYLQKILTQSKTLKEKEDNLKLLGYSNSNLEVLKYVDSSYENSKIIKSLKMGNNGFYSYSKVLTDDNIEKLSKLVEEKINEASKDILNAKFTINPKAINQSNIGCLYCKYSDICFRKNSDIVNLIPKDSSEFLGGE